jgi:putative ATP-dependent endonuclease of OLD family
MHITSLSLRNFRNFRKAKFHFQKGINTLIGENGSGKTNIFLALRLLLDEQMPRKIDLADTDFNRNIGDWRGHWMVISLEFGELDNSEDCQILAVHAYGDADGQSGRFSLLFRPNRNIRKQLFDFSSKNEAEKTDETFQEILDGITIENYESVFRGGGTGDFADDIVYQAYVGNFESRIFPDPNGEDFAVLGTPVSHTELLKDFSCTFVKAMRDVVEDLKNPKTSPLLHLLRKEDKSNINGAGILTTIQDLNQQINQLEEVQRLTTGIAMSVGSAVGHTYAPNVGIRSDVPDDIERLFQSLKLLVGDPDEPGHLGRPDRLSLGGANLIYLSLRLLEYERVLSKHEKAAHFLMIEEPEAHIHTHIQKSIFKNMSPEKMRTQVIVSTHSTHISSASRIRSVNLLSRRGQLAEVFYPANKLEEGQIDAIERYLDAVRSTLLFAKGVVMVEGDAEQILIPELFLKVFGVSLDEMGVSLVNIGSTGFENLALLFDDERVQRRCAIVTDLDEIPVNKKTLKQASSKYRQKWKSYINSQLSGKERKERLGKFVQNNKWVRLFFAKNTFEVDFLQAKNQETITKAVQTIYSRQADIDNSIQKICSKDASVSNLEILRLAEKEGKGWFAILLSKHLTYETVIPNYILEAVAFAAPPPLPHRMLATIAHFRLEKMQASNPTAANLIRDFPEMLTDESAKILGQQFQSGFPDDPLTKFISAQK